MAVYPSRPIRSPCFMDLQPDTVPEAVHILVAVTRIVDHRPGGGIDAPGPHPVSTPPGRRPAR